MVAIKQLGAQEQHTLIHAKVEDVTYAEILPESVDLVFADPPFNVGKDYAGDESSDKRSDDKYYEWCEQWIGQCFRWLKPTGSFYLMTIPRHVGKMWEFMARERGVFINQIAWWNVSGLNDKRRFRAAYQPILVFGKTDEYFFELYAEECKKAHGNWSQGRNERSKRQMKDIWDDIPFVYAGSVQHPEAILKKNSNGKAHPAQMPLGLPSRAIRFSCPENGVVLDPFGGSGTTLEATERLGRTGIAIEQSFDYCNLIIERINNLAPTLF